MQNKDEMLKSLKNNQQFNFDRLLAINDASIYRISKLIIPLEYFSIIQNWEGFYINNNDYYYKGHRLEVEYAE